MPDPKLEYNKEEMQITLTGLTGGWPLWRLGELDLMNSVTWTLPTGWNQYKGAVAMNVVKWSWRMNAHLALEQTLSAGFEYSKNGVGQSVGYDAELVAHILQRPTIQIDMTAKFAIEGSFDIGQRSWDGTTYVPSLGLKFRF